jgi:hypothetical protein
MDTPGPLPRDCHEDRPGALARLPVAVFVTQWRFITGEPPAIMLESRGEMLALLVQSVPVAPLVPVAVDAWGGRTSPHVVWNGGALATAPAGRRTRSG